jgi:hypothetical protein
MGTSTAGRAVVVVVGAAAEVVDADEVVGKASGAVRVVRVVRARTTGATTARRHNLWI